MTLHNCKHCGNLFLKIKSEYCTACQDILDEYYRQVRDFLKAHHGSTMWDIHSKLGIPVSVLQKLMKEDFIPFNN